jgi:hypothetical protein
MHTACLSHLILLYLNERKGMVWIHEKWKTDKKKLNKLFDTTGNWVRKGGGRDRRWALMAKVVSESSGSIISTFWTGEQLLSTHEWLCTLQLIMIYY